MKVIVDIRYKGDLVDAHYVNVMITSGHVGAITLDLTKVIDDQIEIQKLPSKILKARRKELDKRARPS